MGQSGFRDRARPDLTPPPPGAAAHSPAACRVEGRHVRRGDGAVRFDWPAVAVTFRATGSPELWVRLDGGRSLFTVDVLVDGATSPDACAGRVLDTTAGVHDYLVAAGLPLGATVEISLRKRTEARIGNLRGKPTECACLHAVLTHPGGLLLPRDAAERAAGVTRSVEFIGDSDTTAFMNLGKRSGRANIFALDYTKQDAGQSWAAMAADAFGAAHSNVAWSGIGSCYNAPMPGMLKQTMTELYPRLIATDPDSATTDPSALPIADIIVVYLTNDWWTIDKQKGKADGPFVDKYGDFLRAVRALRPTQPILVLCCDRGSGSCMSPREQRRYSDGMARLLRQAAERNGGPARGIHVREVDCKGEISVSNEGDWGGMGHYSIEGHRKWARGVVPLIADVTGWHPIEPTGWDRVELAEQP